MRSSILTEDSVKWLIGNPEKLIGAALIFVKIPWLGNYHAAEVEIEKAPGENWTICHYPICAEDLNDAIEFYKLNENDIAQIDDAYNVDVLEAAAQEYVSLYMSQQKRALIKYF